MARPNDKRTLGRKLEFSPVVARVGLGVLASEWLLEQAGARVIGVNARDLKTLEVDRDCFGRIAPGLPSNVIKISLGGVSNARDLIDAASCGADAVLAAEAVMAADAVFAATRSLAAAGQHPACPSRR